ncbi:MAG: formate dehydrogenase accessory sulfurtransferase FdhD [Acidobacteria bacterium]|nr:formate dehydrogenase accessory sulfurtransferase FdhD [Acidobacteriota bacterium]
MQATVAGSPAVRAVTVRRRGERLDQDLVVVEEPLEIRLDGRPLVVTMRTPGHDEELAAGFLYGEGTITGGEDIASVRAVAGGAEAGAATAVDGAHAGAGRARADRDTPPVGATLAGNDRPAVGGTGGAAETSRGDGSRPEGILRRIRVASFAGDRVEVTLTESAGAEASSDSPAGSPPGDADPERSFAATSACGVCGKESIDDLRADAPAVAPVACAPALLEALPDRLRSAQALFEATGGIHAAGIFTLDGDLLCVREDIGRHNAVDKVIGHFVLEGGVPLRNRILVVSGRAGFELVQKALAASIPAMVSVGAASSVAVDMATAAGMTLYSFAGRGRGNLHVG